MKSILKYPGAKNRIASWIIDYMPKHDTYLEPFAGSLAVLLNKPRCRIETVNDMDSSIVNFFKVLRDRGSELEEKIRMTPYSREEYIMAYQEANDELENARRWAVRCWMGFGCGNLYRNGFKTGQQRKSPNPATAWASLPETLELAIDRLRGVQIENLPATELIKRYDTSDVFIYADPPYLKETRKNYLYKHEMSNIDHEELLNMLVNHPGKVMISGYESDLYNETLCGWNKAYNDTLAECGLKRKEVLWMNYEQSKQMSFEDFPELLEVE